MKYNIYFVYFKKLNIGQDLIEEEKALIVCAISYKLGLHALLYFNYTLIIVLNYYTIYTYHKLNQSSIIIIIKL